MPDSVDEWVVEALGEFDGKPLISAARGSLDLPETEAEKEKKQERSSQYSDLIEKVKTALEDRLSDVRLTDRLTDSPACLVASAALKACLWMASSGMSSLTIRSFPVWMYSLSIFGYVSRTCRLQNGH